MGCNDNGQNGGCRLDQAKVDELASQITAALSNVPISTTVTIGGNVSLGGGDGRGSPTFVGNIIMNAQDLFTGNPPTLNKNKLKDFLCDIAAKAESDVRFKTRAKDLGTRSYIIGIRIKIKKRTMPINIPVNYPMPNSKNISTQSPNGFF